MNEHVTDEVLLSEMRIADYQTRLGSSPFQIHTRMHTCGGIESSLPLARFLSRSAPPAASSWLPLPRLQQSPCVLLPVHLLNTAAWSLKGKKSGQSRDSSVRSKVASVATLPGGLDEAFLSHKKQNVRSLIVDSDRFCWEKSTCWLKYSAIYTNVPITLYTLFLMVWCLMTPVWWLRTSFSKMCCGRHLSPQFMYWSHYCLVNFLTYFESLLFSRATMVS